VSAKTGQPVLPPRRGRLVDRLLGLSADKEKKAVAPLKAVDLEALNSAWNEVTDLLLDPEAFLTFEQFFVSMDDDGSSELDFEELKNGLTMAGCSLGPREMRAFQQNVDVNRDGTVSLAEFMDASSKHQASIDTDAGAAEEAWATMAEFLLDPQTSRNVEGLFQLMNVDGSDDGLDLDELARGMRQLGAQLTAPQLRAWQKDLDANKDGSISLEEFKAAVEERRVLDPEDVANVLARTWDTVLDFALDPARQVHTVDGEGGQSSSSPLEALFRTSDVSATGSLSLDELCTGLVATAGVEAFSPLELRAFQKDLDLNRDGVIHFTEFMDAVRRYQASSVINHAAADEAWDWTLDVLAGSDQEATITEVFRKLDKDGNNELDLDELAAGIVSLGVPLSPRQLRAFQKALDVSGDGLVTLDEFLQVLAQQQKAVQDALAAAWETVMDYSAESGQKAKAYPSGGGGNGDDDDGPVTLEGLFAKMDDDGSGQLDFEEIAKGLFDMGVRMRPRGLRAFRKDVDASGDGQVDPKEFMEGVRRYQALSAADPAAAKEAWGEALQFFFPSSEEEEGEEEVDGEGGEGGKSPERSAEAAMATVAELFKRLDTDGSGQLDLAELIRGLSELGLLFSPKHTRAFQKSLDKNKDGMISYREFKTTLEERQLSQLRDAWQQVPSSSNPEEFFWHNSETGETRWDTPPEVTNL